MPRGEPELIGPIREIEIIAVNLSIRDLERLRRSYGGRRWRKLKGITDMVDNTGEVVEVEVHWYECHGVGRRELKVKIP